jgi:hypothetical protein
MRAQSVVLVQHSGRGSWEANTECLSRHYYDNRAITTPTNTRMATQASVKALARRSGIIRCTLCPRRMGSLRSISVLFNRRFVTYPK